MMGISEGIEGSSSELNIVSSSQEKIYESHLSSDEFLARQLQAFENILIGTSDREFHEIHSMEFPNSVQNEERFSDLEPNLVPVQGDLPDLESNLVPEQERLPGLESNLVQVQERVPNLESNVIAREALRQGANINPDNMSYEELQSLGERVGTENKGLSEDLIAYLPTSKYRTGFFYRKSPEECVVCKTVYKSGERLITLPCQHKYHADCITQWLQINKVCPVCNEEVFG
ncbi:hypothetical protein LUZ60_011806 [Juncus effusus]|nr:hypothetical protein LUZ60_011806 [Juncus effusus]